MREFKIFIILSLLCTVATAAPEAKWIVKKSNGVTTLYTLKKDSRIRGSVRESKVVIRPDKFKDQKFREKIVSKRKSMLSMLGATKWQLKKQIWEDEKVLMMGSYIDREGATVNFLEVHHYKKKGTLQALLTATGKPLDEKGKLAKEFFKMQNLVVKW